MGYSSVTLVFNGDTDLGTISLTPDNSLEEIVVRGSGVIDLAEGRCGVNYQSCSDSRKSR